MHAPTPPLYDLQDADLSQVSDCPSDRRATMNIPWTVLVVDGHPVVRHGLIAALQGQSWVGVVIEASTGAEASRLMTTNRVTVVVLDIQLPDFSGALLCRRLLHINPDARIMAFSMSGDRNAVSAMIDAGALGFVLKQQSLDEVLAAVRLVGGGARVIGPSLDGQSDAATYGRLQGISPRQRTFLSELALGKSNRQIARNLRLSEKTVRNQMSVLFERIGVRDRVQAALIAQAAGVNHHHPASPPYQLVAIGGQMTRSVGIGAS